ncbi:hypothetical protein QQX98_002149 [Neonectria punicea]|uniref:Uncharacterized protein n=1 Tax=Neonectria punicea TaxID=979145 RepID=A0ABR1HK03_9HYPO
MPRERPPTEEPTSSSKGAAPPEPPAEFPKPPEPRPKRKRSQKTEDTGEPRGKKKQPPAKTGSQEDNYLSLHQQKMHSALDDTLFVVKQKMRTRCRASRSLSTLDLDKFIACDDGEENDMRDQWNNSADKRDLESNISKRMMELWNICLRIYNSDSHRKRYTAVNIVE